MPDAARQSDSWAAGRVRDYSAAPSQPDPTELPGLFSEEHPLLTPFARELFAGLYHELCAIDERIQSLEQRIQASFESNSLCQKIAEVEGVGPVIATAVIAAVANG